MRHNQNRRSRGRSNNRKGPNPLTRSYESNGPDVKVRGTAMHVAEKYMSLARDALSSGDNVAAENYLQHAEHYNRIVAAAQIQLQQSQPQQFREGEEGGDDDERAVNGRPRDRFGYFSDGDGDEGGDERFDSAFEDEGDRRPQRVPPRQDYRETRGEGQPDRFNGDRPRRDNRDRDNRDRDSRGERFGGDRQRQDFRGGRGEGRNDGSPDRFNGDRPRQDNRSQENRDRDGGESRAAPAPVRYADETGARDERERSINAAPDADEALRTASAGPDLPQGNNGPGSLEAADDSTPRPRRRRPPRAAKNGVDPAGEADGTRDGEAALAAFPE